MTLKDITILATNVNNNFYNKLESYTHGDSMEKI